MDNQFELRGEFRDMPQFNYNFYGTKEYCLGLAKKLAKDGVEHSVHGTDKDGKEYIVYSTSFGDVPHEHRYVRPENLVEGM